MLLLYAQCDDDRVRPRSNAPEARLTGGRQASSRRPLAACLLLCCVMVLGPPDPALSQGLLVEVLGLEDGLPSPSIVDLAQDPSGRIWILTRLGTSIYDGRTLETFVGGDGLFSSTLDRLVVDAQGRAWAMSRQTADAFRLEDRLWKALPAPPPRPENPRDEPGFLQVVEAGDSTLIVSATGDGPIWIWRLNNEKISGPSAPNGPQPAVLRAMEPFENSLMLATDDGLCDLSVDGDLRCDLAANEPRLATPIHALHRQTSENTEQHLWILAEKPVQRPGSDLTEAWIGYLHQGTLTVTHPDLPPVMLRPRQATNFKTLLLRDRSRDTYFGNDAALYRVETTSQKLTTLDLPQGMASTGTSSLLLDRESNIWSGGPRGLSRLGSRRFISYDRRHGLVENEVTAVLEPNPGQMIFGHNLGLSILEEDSILTYPFENPAPSRNDYRVLDMASDSSGNVWMVTSNAGVMRFDRRGRITQEHPEIRVARSLAHSPQGALWLLAEQGLFELTDKGFVLRHQPEGLRLARWLTFTRDGTFLVSTARGLLRLPPNGTWQTIHGPSPQSDNLFGIVQRKSGEIWLGSSVGPYVLNHEKLEPVDEPFPGILAPVFTLFEDPDERVWLGTDNGARVWDGKHLRHLTVSHGLAGRETNRGAGFVDSQGRVWLGTDGGVSVYRKSRDKEQVPPALELVGVEANGTFRRLDRDLGLEHTERDLAFQFRAVGLSKEEPLLIQHRLEGLEPTYQGPDPLSTSAIRYTRLAPGTYRFRIRAGWQGGRWSPELVSPWITIPRPFWQTKVFHLGAFSLALALMVGIYRLRTRTVTARASELEAMNLKLREAAEERERLIESLEAQNVELERFSFTVSHDLKSPLLTIRGFVGCVREAHRTGQLETVTEDLNRIEGAAARMTVLLEELLELARIGQVLHPSESICLSTLMEEVIELSAAEIAERGIQLDVEPDLPKVFGDRQRLRMVFQNLVDNAIKFTHNQEHPSIAIRGRDTGDQIVISMEDNGLGIEPDHQELIFGLFKRLHPGVAGTGVGLALVQRIVEAHGGTISVTSAGLGQGSRFDVSLPKEPPPPQQPGSLSSTGA